LDRQQRTLFPEYLEDWICEDNPVRVIDVFVGKLDLAELKFEEIVPEATGRGRSSNATLYWLTVGAAAAGRA
jgi:hypothetical protein